RNADRKLDLHEKVKCLRLFDGPGQLTGDGCGCARFPGPRFRRLWRRNQRLEVAAPSHVELPERGPPQRNVHRGYLERLADIGVRESYFSCGEARHSLVD